MDDKTKARDAMAAMISAVKECIDAETERRKKLKDGAPASTYTDARLKRLRAALAKAEAIKQD